MVVECSRSLPIKVSFENLKKHLEADEVRFRRNFKFDLEGVNDWIGGIETDISYLMVSLDGILRNGLSLAAQSNDALKAYSPILFLGEYDSNLTRLDGSRSGPVGLFSNALAIADCLAAGRFNNAQTLRDQAVQLLGQRAYKAQELYAEDLELQKDPENDIEIIPQRLFSFAHELMGLRAGEAQQPWNDWDIIGDQDYIAAARKVYTEDMDEAALTLCQLCNLHVQYSNPFPEGNEDDHLSGFEFDTPVRAIWPTEIFAWLRVRQERGLPLPEVDHPLLNQPLGQFDTLSSTRWEHEPWFIELVQKLVEFHPRYAGLPQMVFDQP